MAELNPTNKKKAVYGFEPDEKYDTPVSHDYNGNYFLRSERMQSDEVVAYLESLGVHPQLAEGRVRGAKPLILLSATDYHTLEAEHIADITPENMRKVVARFEKEGNRVEFDNSAMQYSHTPLLLKFLRVHHLPFTYQMTGPKSFSADLSLKRSKVFITIPADTLKALRDFANGTAPPGFAEQTGKEGPATASEGVTPRPPAQRRADAEDAPGERAVG